jgi:DNA-directed RNA polymerase subunit RPC12/RpoP
VSEVKAYTGPPATLGSTAAAQVRLIVWCRDCRHRVEPDPAEMAARYGAEMTVPEWHKRLVCSQCGSKAIDFVLTGARQ